MIVNWSAPLPLIPTPARGTAVSPGFETVKFARGTDVAPTVALAVVGRPRCDRQRSRDRRRSRRLPDTTSDDDTDNPSPPTVSDELALPSAVGWKTIVTMHCAPGANVPPHWLAVIVNGAAGGMTCEMLIGTADVFAHDRVLRG